VDSLIPVVSSISVVYSYDVTEMLFALCPVLRVHSEPCRLGKLLSLLSQYDVNDVCFTLCDE